MGAAELADLQRIDDRNAELRREVSALEARMRGSAQLAEARRELHEREAELAEAEAAVDAAESHAAGLRTRAAVLEKQLYGGSVRNPQELLTLDRELAELRTRLAAEEDDELERMQSADSAQAAVREARTAVEEIEGRRAAEAGPDQERLAVLRERITDVLAERDLERGRRSAAELALYDRLAVRLHPAVARLGAGDVCSGCRIAVSPREARAVRVGEGITQCPNCDRILAR